MVHVPPCVERKEIASVYGEKINDDNATNDKKSEEEILNDTLY